MHQTIQRIGFPAGPLVALLLFFALPDHYVDIHKALIPLTFAAKSTLCVTVWMAIWWLSEAIDISATALLPIAVFPLFGIADIKTTTAPYASHLIFLFMGGFVIAFAMQRWKLDRRLATTVLSLVGQNPFLIIAGFMFAAAVLSGFITNTATTAVMLPIGLSIIAMFCVADKSGQLNKDQNNFAKCVMLGIAYAASIGGTTTVIGTAPNIFLAGFVEESISEPFQREISFANWISFAAPLAIVFTPIVWWMLTKVVFPFRTDALSIPTKAFTKNQEKMNGGQIITILVFLFTVLLWILRPLLQKITFSVSEQSYQPFAYLSDPGIAMLAAMLLFIIPVNFKQRIFAMDWHTAKKLPWGIFILFGGGLTLAKAIKTNGVAEFIGAQAVLLPNLPEFVFVLIVCATVIFLTELTSNTATTATLVPILAAIAIGLDIHPYLLIFPATLAASFAFMMPIATPPNAIVFGSGYISIPDMCKAGIWLNLLGVVVITVFTYLVIKPVLQF